MKWSSGTLFISLCTLLVVISFTAGCADSREQKPLTISFIDVGQGDSCLLQFNGKTMLVDAGPYEAGPVITDWLESQNISSLDIVVSTHPHSDHIGGMPYLLRKLNVRTFIDTGDTHTTPTYEKLLRTIESRDIAYKTVKSGDTISLDPDLKIEVLSPKEPLGEDLNDNSMVLKVSTTTNSILLMGDAGITIEERLLSEGRNLKADLLKVGHHGSRHSSGKKFIQAVSPEIAIISMAADNEYGYPQKDPIRYLTDRGTKIYRTDQEGTITVNSGEGPLKVITNDGVRDQSYCSCSAIQEFCRGSAGVNNICCSVCEG
ncbi:MAG TPA: MBL fold metallo-hydrolase [Methanospirillum sp.]|nr:MBL fold metallo-hydrolase [Methanospirillum sp.]